MILKKMDEIEKQLDFEFSNDKNEGFVVGVTIGRDDYLSLKFIFNQIRTAKAKLEVSEKPFYEGMEALNNL